MCALECVCGQLWDANVSLWIALNLPNVSSSVALTLRPEARPPNLHPRPSLLSPIAGPEVSIGVLRGINFLS